jgi:hypothetical protein
MFTLQVIKLIKWRSSELNNNLQKHKSTKRLARLARKWGEEQQKSFDEINQKVSQETLLAFPDFEKESHVYTDASSTQLGAVIMKEGKPLAFQHATSLLPYISVVVNHA